MCDFYTSKQFIPLSIHHGMTHITVGFFADSLERLEAFRQQEVESIVEVWCRENQTTNSDEVCRFLEDPSTSRVSLIDFASKSLREAVCARSMLLHSVFEYIAMARSIPLLLQKLRCLKQHLLGIGMGPGKRFKLHLEACGFSFTLAEKGYLYEIIGSALPQEGIIDLAKPESAFWIFFEGTRHNGPISIQRICMAKLLHLSARKQINEKYSLKTRPHIGTTSLPPELAFMVANIALIRPHTAVYDCFCGTGSTLTTAAHFGAASFGSDRDARTIRERPTQKPKPSTKKMPKPRAVDLELRGAKSVFTNMAHYGHQGAFVDVMRVSAESCANLWRATALFDAIVSDPPYGIREGVKKVDRARCLQMHMDRLAMNQRSDANAEEPKVLISSIPFEQYTTEELETDLLNFAAARLRLHGRLVFWHPTAVDVPDTLPTHPCLLLRYRATQYVNTRFSRDLLVYEKIAEEHAGLNAKVNVWRRRIVERQRSVALEAVVEPLSVRESYYQTRTLG